MFVTRSWTLSSVFLRTKEEKKQQRKKTEDGKMQHSTHEPILQVNIPNNLRYDDSLPLTEQLNETAGTWNTAGATTHQPPPSIHGSQPQKNTETSPILCLLLPQKDKIVSSKFPSRASVLELSERLDSLLKGLRSKRVCEDREVSDNECMLSLLGEAKRKLWRNSGAVKHVCISLSHSFNNILRYIY